MARAVHQQLQSGQHPRGSDGVIVTKVQDLPVGVVVTVIALPPASEVSISGNGDMEGFKVISGGGWVDSAECGRQPLATGSTAFVPAHDTATLGSDEGMTVVGVFGGWMMPS